MPSITGSTSQFLGVSWAARCSKWVAQIKADGRNKFLGHFLCETEAALAYDTAARLHHGQFANLNFPAETS